MKMLTLLFIAGILLIGCSKKPEPEPQELKFHTVMECINDAKLNDRDMTLIGNNARDMSVEDFVAWYNKTYAK